MVRAYQQSGPMVQVRMVMEATMERLIAATDCLTAAGVEEALALVLDEASVGAGAADEQEADLAIGGRFKLASNCRKDGYYAKR